MTPADRAALEIGRLFMRAHAAEAQAAVLAARLQEFEQKPEETPVETPERAET